MIQIVPPARVAAARLAPMLLVAVAACGGDDSMAPPAPPPGLEVSIDPQFVGPREQLRIIVEVSPLPADPIAVAWLHLATGTERDSLALPFSGDQPQGVYVDLTIPNAPISAVVQVAARVRTQRRATAEATGAFTIGDTTPPGVRFVNVDDSVYAGQTAYVSADYSDRSGLVRTEFRLSGALVRDEIYDPDDLPTYGATAFEIVVPEQPGDSIVQRAAAVDMYGLRREIRQVYHIVARP